MKWFKHISDSLSDPFIFELLDKFGADGYYVFFGAIEVYSREFKAEDGWRLSVRSEYLHRKLFAVTKKKMLGVLSFLDDSDKWEVESVGKNIFIYIPKFIGLMDGMTIKKLKQQDYKYNDGSASWLKIKKKIRKRDHFCCVLCGKTTEENKKSLQVHHIKPFKLFKNTDEANKESNLISVCISCRNQIRTGVHDDKINKIQNGIQNGIKERSRTESRTPEVEVEVEVEAEVKNDLSIIIDKSANADIIPFNIPKKTKGDSKHFSAKVGDYFKSIKTSCETCWKFPHKNGFKFNPYQWIQDHTNKGYHPGAMDETMKAMADPKVFNGITGDPYPYANSILKTKNQNWNEAEAVKIHEGFKKMTIPALEKLTAGMLKGVE